ncbi:acyl-CoA dehydrogenase family protein [Nocardia sp. alder85J]|uniref:acyl-CoA dehydrogenase family protein n=1 Tax=Nocardia sp. alder85J TaxID=2862949 RepID=UPI001CD60E80|nr:acyl-CoA dehydrogenase family protein [Nocardia sp. alder85J]MCX4095750.1 acyl-CoA/acyl-ACP dehydrogenase [Nocardia sp. alder85J]
MTHDTPDRTDELAELRRLADSIFGAAADAVLDVPDTAIDFDATLWKTLADSGLALLTTPESAGGSGATVADSAVVLESAAAHAAPMPLAETDLLASWLLRTAGLPVPDGPLTAVYDPALTIRDGGVRAQLDRVPWARIAHAIVLADDHAVVSVRTTDIQVEPGADLASDPRDRIVIDTDIDRAEIGPAPGDIARSFLLRGALARSIQIVGAVTRALDLTVRHVGTREQFGRPIGKFQAVQAMVAEAAEAVAMARAATDFAVDTVTAGGFDDERAAFAIAIAKVQASRAAPIVARIAHQAHGAIGFTLDHRLRHFTLRALAWRSEFGGPHYWERELGETVLRQPRNGLWGFITGTA